MKKTALLIFLLLLSGCATVTSYDYKADISFNKTNFQKAPEIGISIHNNHINDLQDVMEKDLLRFSETPLKFDDLSNDLIVTFDGLNIDNCNELRNKYPHIEYIITVFQDDPKITKSRSREEVFRHESIYYRTTMRIRSEIMLIDLNKCRVIAKTEKIFKDQRANEKEPHFQGNTLFGFLEDFIGDPNGPFPEFYAMYSSKAATYFYFFLKHINHTDFYDFEYFNGKDIFEIVDTLFQPLSIIHKD